MGANHLKVLSFTNIFSNPASRLFHFVNGFFCHEIAFKFLLVPLVTFALVSFALGDKSKKKQCYDLHQRVLCLCSLLEILWFHTSHLGIQYIFSLHFYIRCEEMFKSVLYTALQFSQHHFMKRLFFLHYIFFPLL